MTLCTRTTIINALARAWYREVVVDPAVRACYRERPQWELLGPMTKLVRGLIDGDITADDGRRTHLGPVELTSEMDTQLVSLLRGRGLSGEVMYHAGVITGAMVPPDRRHL